MEGDVEGLVEVGVVDEEGPAEEPGDDDQMPGAGDGQELSQALTMPG
jgi:hypothetical protein